MPRALFLGSRKGLTIVAMIAALLAVVAGVHALAAAAVLADVPSPPAVAEINPVRTPSKPAPVTVTPTSTPKPMPSASPTEAAVATAEPYVIKHILPIAGVMHHGDHYWDESGAPATGPIVITVDLQAQVLSVFRGGYEIGTAVILYGADAKPTPLGVYPITAKDAKHVSNIYHAPMPYMLRMTNDGISIHASSVKNGYMTHGCIGVPTAFAKQLFAAVKVGDRVIVSSGEQLGVGKTVTAI